MNREPHELNNADKRQELQQEQEAFRLRQEEQRLRDAERRSTFAWIRNSILLLVSALEILLAIRFFLRVAGANTSNAFAQFIYNLSEGFVAPFSTLFISPVKGDGAYIFDVNILIAMLVYALLGWLALAIVNYVQGRQP